MRAWVLIVALLGGCIDELELTGPDPCTELAAPDAVAIGEPFSVEVVCPDGEPAWFEYDFGDASEIVRTAAARREHAYGDDAANHFQFRVRVFYRGADGAVHDLEATIRRR